MLALKNQLPCPRADHAPLAGWAGPCYPLRLQRTCWELPAAEPHEHKVDYADSGVYIPQLEPEQGSAQRVLTFDQITLKLCVKKDPAIAHPLKRKLNSKGFGCNKTLNPGYIKSLNPQPQTQTSPEGAGRPTPKKLRMRFRNHCKDHARHSPAARSSGGGSCHSIR